MKLYSKFRLPTMFQSCTVGPSLHMLIKMCTGQSQNHSSMTIFIYCSCALNKNKNFNFLACLKAEK